MKKFMVIVKVGNVDYLARIEAESAYAAEHYYLDQAYCGRHEYGVDCAMAYDVEAMKTENFRAYAINAEPIGNVELSNIISARNANIQARDEAEDLIRNNENEIRNMEKQIAALQLQIAQARMVIG